MALSCCFAPIALLNADSGGPVITNPADLNYLDVNTAFDPTPLSPLWTVKAPMPTARAGFAIAAANDGISDKIYVIGGAYLNDCSRTDAVEAYDPAADSWVTDLPPIPESNWRASAATLGNTIYVVGGASTESDCIGLAVDTVQAYDTVSGTWSRKAPLLSTRLQVGLCADPVNNVLYAIGGLEGEPNFTALRTVDIYDPIADQWTPTGDLNTARGLPAVAALNGTIYAVGGQDTNRPVRTVEVYDPVAKTWALTGSREPDPARLNPGSAVLNGKVYILGGQLVADLNRPLSDMSVYDPMSDSWATAPSLPTARLSPGAATVGNILYAMGGQAPVGRVGEQFTYQITATNNPTSYGATALPPGLNFDTTRGIISGVPSITVSSYLVTFSATNADNLTGYKTVSFYIAPPISSPNAPNIISSTCVTARTNGERFTYQVLTNNASPLAQLAATGLPYAEGIGGGPELTIDPGTGLISGIVSPSSDGSAQSFGVELALTDGLVTQQSYLELTFVSSDAALPVINSPANASLVLNKFFSYKITADVPATSFDYIGLGGTLNKSLPPGLTFDGVDTISGIYTGQTDPGRPRRSASVGDSSTRRAAGGSIDGIETIKKEPPPHIQLVANGNGADTGTAPLNFIIGLHDLEIEALINSTSAETPYVIFTDDPLASGGSGGMLESTKVGDYVTYSVPVTVAGTYDVKVGIKKSATAGMFQLAIDDLPQGPVQDEYSSEVGYEVRDLGPVTFDSAGTKMFQFTVTGQNPDSTGYELVLDYVDLDPYFEAELLTVEDHSASYVTINNANLSGGSGTLFKAAGKDDYLIYRVPIAVPGTYNVSVGTKTNRSNGVFQLSIDGAHQGYPQDEYGSTATFGARDLGTIKFATAGDKFFQFMVAGKNPLSKGYELVFDYLHLVLTTQLEVEALPPPRANAPLLPIDDENLSGATGTLLNAGATGKFITYTVAIPAAGTYDVRVGIRTGNKGGIFQLAIGGIDQGSPQDDYSAKIGYKVLDLGRRTFTQAGNALFQFSVTDRNANSRGYQLAFDYVDLAR